MERIWQSFQRGLFPLNPVWDHFHACTDKIAVSLSTKLFKNSVEVFTISVEKICRTAGENNIYVIMGICENLSGTKGTIGTMYNSQIIID